MTLCKTIVGRRNGIVGQRKTIVGRRKTIVGHHYVVAAFNEALRMLEGLEYVLEGHAGFRGVAPLSAEATFLLPDGFG